MRPLGHHNRDFCLKSTGLQLAVAALGDLGLPFPLLPRPPGAMQLDSGLPVLKSELLSPSLWNEESRSCTAWAQLAQPAPPTPPPARAGTLSPNYWEALAKIPAPPRS